MHVAGCWAPLLAIVLLLCIRNVYSLSLRNSKSKGERRLSGVVPIQRNVEEQKAVAHYTYKAAVEEGSPMLLVDFVSAKFSAKKTQAKQWLVYKSVYVNDEIQSTHNFDLRVGDIVSVRLGKVGASVRSSDATGRLPNGLKIVHEDSSIIVVEKPAKMLVSTKDISLKDKSTKAIQTALHHINSVLGKRKKSSKAMLVHSLDEEASGLMIFAKTLPAKEYLLSNWHSNIGKTYTCLCYGKLSPLQGTLSLSDNELSNRGGTAAESVGESKKNLISGSQASVKYNYTSNYRSLDVSGDMPYSIVEFSLDRMSAEQLQRKMSQMDKPIVGDTKHNTNGADGGGAADRAGRDPLRRLCMHCSELKLFHPESKEKMSFQSRVPPSFLSLLHRTSNGEDNSAESINTNDDGDDIDDEKIYESRNIEIVKVSDFLKQTKSR